MDQVYIITLCLIVALLFSETLRRFRISRVVSLILAGVFLGLPGIEDWIGIGGMQTIFFLSSIGIVFLLIITGLEADFWQLLKSSKEEILISFFATATPFILGIAVLRLLGFDWVTGFVVGATLSATSEATNTIALMEQKVLKTRLGSIILGAGILDDISEVAALAVLTFLISSTSKQDLFIFPLKIILFAFGAYLIFKLVIPPVTRYIANEHSDVERVSFVILFALLVASFTLFLGFGPIIGAFFAGILIQVSMKDRKAEHHLAHELKTLTFAFIIPFFFMQAGLTLNMMELINSWALILLILAIAVVGTFAGTLIAKVFTTLTWPQTWLVAWAMNSKGAVELVIATIALEANLISSTIFSAIVVTTLVTTMAFPFALRHFLKKYPNVMD